MSRSGAKGYRILVVDDDPGIRLTVGASLANHGFLVEEAADGGAALEAFAKDPPDLVMLDIMMPDLSGFQVCEIIRDSYQHLHTPVIMLTGLDDTDAVQQAYEAGASDFVTKPINYPLMNYRVEYVLRASQIAKELRDSERRQKQAQRVAKLGHVEWGADETILHCSEGVRDIFEVPPGDQPATLDELTTLLSVSDRLKLRELVAATINAGSGTYHAEHRLTLPGDRLKFITQNGEIKYTSDGRANRVIATFQDITLHKLAEEKIHQMANYDELTGFPKRELMLEYLGQEIERARRYARCFVVMVLSIDNLKRYNDIIGFDAANELVKQYALRLKSYCRVSDFIAHESLDEANARTAVPGTSVDSPARLSGGEFLVTLSQVPDAEASRLVVNRLKEDLKAGYQVAGREMYITTCVGISVFPLDGETPEQLIRAAEMALSAARKRGTDNYQYYTESLNERVMKKFSMETELRNAIRENRLQVHYQPKQELATGRIVGLEALARWPHPVRGYIPPIEFVAVAEETGLIDALGESVLKVVATDLARSRNEETPFPPVAINLSPMQFERASLAEVISAYLRQWDLQGSDLEFEITESVLMRDLQRSVQLLDEFRELGFSVSIDDFGTGYSSLAYLKTIPASSLKIDRTFVKGLGRDREDEAIVRGIIQLGHSLSMSIVAEGVESTTQLEILRGEGADVIQGYLLSYPRPYAEMLAWLRERHRGAVPARTVG